MIASHIINDCCVNIIEVESLTSFTPEEGYLIDYKEFKAEIGFKKYDGIWKLDKDIASANVEEQRKKLLEYSDIVMLPDNYAKLNEEQKTEWIDYRQALRDVTKQEGYPWEITWPIKPSYNPLNKTQG